jgi:hypothetical protein
MHSEKGKFLHINEAKNCQQYSNLLQLSRCTFAYIILGLQNKGEGVCEEFIGTHRLDLPLCKFFDQIFSIDIALDSITLKFRSVANHMFV